MPTNKTIDCQCGHSITAHLTVCDDCSCYKFESKSKPTPNPQKTVELCPYLEMRGHSLPHDWDSQWCKNCGRFRETLPNTQSPKLAEPHVVQVPQESSPGFEEVLLQRIYGVAHIIGLPNDDDAEDVKAILAAHNSAIQAAKRETLQKLTEAYIGRTFNAKTDWHLEFERLVGILAAELKQLEEETTA